MEKIWIGKGGAGAEYYGQYAWVPHHQNSYVEILIPNMIIVGNGIFGVCSGYKDGVLKTEISVP